MAQAGHRAGGGDHCHRGAIVSTRHAKPADGILHTAVGAAIQTLQYIVPGLVHCSHIAAI